MRAGFSEVWKFASMRWIAAAETGALGGAAWLSWCRMQWNAGERRRRAKIQAELEVYARLDVRVSADSDMRELGRRVCRVVAENSSFYRIALLDRDAHGQVYVAGSTGMDGETVKALHDWGELAAEVQRDGGARTGRGESGWGISVGQASVAVVLEGCEGRALGRAIVVPVRTAAGKMLGAVAVCADGMLSVRRRDLDKALQPLEMLAVRLGRAMENAALEERLLRAERLAGLGLLAGGIAHALNNPLTAVLGFAELIAGTSDEARVRQDAETIVREALRMRDTVDLLLAPGRMGRDDEAVNLLELMRELGEGCREKLESRGVRLTIEGVESHPMVRGSRERLRQMLEHLLNHAAEAVGSVEAPEGEGGHTIRLSVGQDGGVHLIVSDTGAGFRQPTRVFDLFSGKQEGGGADRNTDLGTDMGTDLELSLCYGIVREHGGEISAFNLDPRGSTVVIELPVGNFSAEKIGGVMVEVGNVP